MASVTTLTSRQKEELHKSILAYLQSSGLTNTVACLREELDFVEPPDDATLKKYEGLLEKKWTTVLRLQKKIMELEAKNTSLQSELDSATPTSLRKNADPTAWLPRAPARHDLSGHQNPVTSVAFHPTFSVLASGSEDCTIKLWDWEDGEFKQTIKGHTKAVLDVDFGGPPGGILLASCSSDLTIKLWDPGNDYKNIRTLTGHDHSISAVRFIPSEAGGQHLVSASRDKTLKIWEVNTGYCIRTIEGHSDWIRDVTPSFDGKWLLSAGSDQTARIWDPSNGEPKATLVGHEHVIECCVYAPPTAYPHLAKLAGLKKPPPASSSSEYIATGSRDKTIRIWDTRGSLIKTLHGHDNWVRALQFHPGGKYLLSVSDDKTLRAWDLTQGGQCVKRFEAADHFVTSIRWAPAKEKKEITNGDAKTNGVGPSGAKKDEYAPGPITCVLATGSVDSSVRIFAT
ncbi:nuclear distribution protein nudF [Ascobolus immersus RN42]|uniref:Nuclear distribution protein PAC1 n=1 Tax=Ascobolus immersus RN42 TaxID=1160509 RepID=A0A3N4HML2_ASCIM|nr:nuclear distribution protein nudF [Ascobolus immersus RN42]